jgi:hypothetical protein
VLVNQWTVISIPMSQLNPGGYVIQQVFIQNYTALTPTFYLDNIRLVGNSTIVPQAVPDAPVQQSVHEEMPTSYALQQNFPNPFNPSTNIEYSLPDEARVSMKIYNSLGEEMAILVDGIQTAGYKSVTWDGSRLSSGLYFCRLTATSTVTNETFTQTKRMLLVK